MRKAHSSMAESFFNFGQSSASGKKDKDATLKKDYSMQLDLP